MPAQPDRRDRRGDDDVDALVAEALSAPLAGWDSSWADGRVRTALTATAPDRD